MNSSKIFPIQQLYYMVYIDCYIPVMCVFYLLLSIKHETSAGMNGRTFEHLFVK